MRQAAPTAFASKIKTRPVVPLYVAMRMTYLDQHHRAGGLL